MADIDEARLKEVGKDVASIIGEANVLVVPTDVSKLDEVVRLRDKVYEQWGEVRMTTYWRLHFPCLSNHHHHTQ